VGKAARSPSGAIAATDRRGPEVSKFPQNKNPFDQRSIIDRAGRSGDWRVERAAL